MNKIQKKLFTAYKEWLNTGKLPTCGLCVSFGTVDFKLPLYFEKTFYPNGRDFNKLYKESKSAAFWGYDVSRNDTSYSYNNELYEFTELRQTMMCFLIAMLEDETLLEIF